MHVCIMYFQEPQAWAVSYTQTTTVTTLPVRMEGLAALVALALFVAVLQVLSDWPGSTWSCHLLSTICNRKTNKIHTLFVQFVTVVRLYCLCLSPSVSLS